MGARSLAHQHGTKVTRSAFLVTQYNSSCSVDSSTLVVLQYSNCSPCYHSRVYSALIVNSWLLLRLAPACRDLSEPLHVSITAATMSSQPLYYDKVSENEDDISLPISPRPSSAGAGVNNHSLFVPLSLLFTRF